MNEKLTYVMFVIFEAILVWLMLKYTSYEVTTLALLIQIYCKMLVKD